MLFQFAAVSKSIKLKDVTLIIGYVCKNKDLLKVQVAKQLSLLDSVVVPTMPDASEPECWGIDGLPYITIHQRHGVVLANTRSLALSAVNYAVPSEYSRGFA